MATTIKKLKAAIAKAKVEVKQFNVAKMVGITTDATWVYGAECIAYQRDINKLYCVINGNWRFVRKKNYSGWEKGHTTVTYYSSIKQIAAAGRDGLRKNQKQLALSGD